MPTTYDTPLISSSASPPYDVSHHEYRSRRGVFRLFSRSFIVFAALLLLNNVGWTYFYSRGTPESLARFAQSSTQEVVPTVPSSHHEHRPSTPRPNHHVSPRLETIEIIMVMIGADSATEGATAIKSALMLSSRPLSFRIICGKGEEVSIIKRKLALFSRPAYSVDISFYPMSLEQIKARADRSGVGTKYFAGMGGLVKVFLHELLPGVDRAIFVDTDMLFVVDPVLLWNTFSTMQPKQMIAFPTLGPKSDASRICTCVMLLNLAAMRNYQRPFMSSSLLPSWSKHGLSSKAFEIAMKGDGLVPTASRTEFVKFDPRNPLYGDQGIYHVIWTHFPQYFAHLSLRWDVTHCRKGYGLKLGHRHDPEGEEMTETDQIKSQFYMEEAPEKYEQMIPGILHFNCQNKPIVWDFEENYEENTWSSMITMITRYKWIWLNRGDGSAGVRSIVVENVRFEDERAAEEERLSRLALEEGVGVGSKRGKARLDNA